MRAVYSENRARVELDVYMRLVLSNGYRCKCPRDTCTSRDCALCTVAPPCSDSAGVDCEIALCGRYTILCHAVMHKFEGAPVTSVHSVPTLVRWFQSAATLYALCHWLAKHNEIQFLS